MCKASKVLARVFIIPECQRGFVGGIQFYIFNYVIFTHGESLDVVLCLTPVKKKETQCYSNKIYGRDNIRCITLYAPSVFRIFTTVVRVLARMSKYREKIEIYSVPHIYSPFLALLKFNQTLFLLQKPRYRILSLLYHTILSKFNNVRYVASDVRVATMYKPIVNKIGVFFPDPSKVFTSLREELPKELARMRLYDMKPVIVYIGYIEYPRFSIPHFIVFLKLLRSLTEERNKNPLVILVVRRTEYSNELIKYLINKLASLQLNNNVVIVSRFLAVEEKLAILKMSDATLYFLLDVESTTLRPTIPPYTLAESVALGKPIILFVNGQDKLETLGSLYTRWNKYIHVIDVSNSNYISDLRKVVENVLLT